MSLICISPIFFCHGHYWLVYQLVLSVVDKNDWYINRFCLSWTILVVVGEPKTRIVKKNVTLAPEWYTAEFLHTDSLDGA